MTTIRLMRPDDLSRVLDWAADEGWNPGLDDAAAFLASDPEGFFVTEADGAPVAAISVVNHSPDFAFLGLYLCQPAWRGRGIGLRLWTHALTHAGGADGRSGRGRGATGELCSVGICAGGQHLAVGG